MVRIKHRYILFEILYPNTPRNEQSNSSSNISNSSIQLIPFHRSSPNEITPKVLLKLLRKSLSLYFGDYGSGISSASLQIKYFSNKTLNGILRVARENVKLVHFCLTLLNQILNYNVSVHVLRISATISHAQRWLVERNQNYIKTLSNQFKIEKNNENTNNIAQLFNKQ